MCKVDQMVIEVGSLQEKAKAERRVDEILDFAIEYRTTGLYPEGLNANKKRAVRKRATAIIVDQGEVFLKKKYKVRLYITCMYVRIMCACMCFYSFCLFTWMNIDFGMAEGEGGDRYQRES